MATHFHSSANPWSLASAIILFTLILFDCACTNRARTSHLIVPAQANDQLSNAHSNSQTTSTRINVNTASANELETLPGIGKGLAERIVEHRQKYGPFRRPEHLIIVRGISEKRFRAIRDLITVE